MNCHKMESFDNIENNKKESHPIDTLFEEVFGMRRVSEIKNKKEHTI